MGSKKIINIFKTSDKAFKPFLKKLLARGEAQNVEPQVRTIIEAVRRGGDRKLLEFTRRFDGVELKAARLRVKQSEIERAYKKLTKDERKTLEFAAQRIRAFHQLQGQKSWISKKEDGALLGQLVRPLESAGLYVPGGRAAYPSSVLMNALPAKVAGVKRVVMVTPPGSQGINPYVLAAAKVAGVEEIYQVGGAQAVAALAYGTKTIKPVDKIVGPGNIYVATAKRLVFGVVDIDMVAGPSEILVIADNTAKAEYIAADLLSQAEHDPLAAAILVTDSLTLAGKVVQEVEAQAKTSSRPQIIRRSLTNYGAIFLVPSIDAAMDLANAIAPEHLELMLKNPRQYLPAVKNAGAVFLGAYTPEPIGDYVAGPNHVLPTGGTARFSSPLRVEDFQKCSSLLYLSAKKLQELGPLAVKLAEMEGLGAHGRSVKVRIENLVKSEKSRVKR
jgi:histidinol dehydrogenase